MILKINSENPSPRKIKQIVEILKKDGVIIYPTDTVYALGCDIFSTKAMKKIYLIRGLNAKTANLSFIVNEFSQIAQYTSQISNPIFRLIKKNLPGPFTFIFNANNKVPKLMQSKKKQVGIRFPDYPIANLIIEELGRPILSASLKDKSDPDNYPLEPYKIIDEFHNRVDLIIDSDVIGNIPSTVVDCTTPDIQTIREGKGILIL